jgi:G3E family GTPase
MQPQQHKKTPVTILTGFLGAGKTTLLNEIISQHPDTRFAIIENEFGEIGIDQELVLNKDKNLFEMSNGCICCTINNELADTLLELSRSDKPFDHLLIETTGIADPMGVTEAFLSDPLIQQKYIVDGLICLVDTEQVEDLLSQEEEVARQISAADVIIFNKTDLMRKEYLEEVKQTVKKINPYAICHESSQEGTDTTGLLQLKAYTVSGFHERHKAVVAEHHREQHHHHHISTYSFSFEEPLDLQKFQQWANMLLTFQNERIYRIKGILNFKGEETKTIFQSVKTRYLLVKGKEWEPEETRLSKIVFIGRELRKDILEKNLRQCRYKV